MSFANNSAPYPVGSTTAMNPSAPPPPSYNSSSQMGPSHNTSMPTSKIEIIISCQDLMNKDTFSKSDPLAVVYLGLKDATGVLNWKEHGRTEQIQNSNDPEFVTRFTLDYRFEEQQYIKIAMYDIDSSSKRLENHDFLGEDSTTLGQIVSAGAGGEKYTHKLGGGNSGVKITKGSIVIVSEELSSAKETFQITLKGRGLDKKDFFGLSDPFLMFYRANEGGAFSLVHKTEIIKNTLNPIWKTITTTSRNICNGDIDRTIKVECYDWDSDGSHDLIGLFTTNARELKEKSGKGLSFELINPKKKAKKKKYTNSGHIDVVSFVSEIEPSFLDYIYAGTQINFSVAVDFTASNGNPMQPNSLHYRDPYTPNQYVQALSEVGYICQQYDSDKLIPAYGFGARVPPSNEIMHVFNLNFQQDPNCMGIEGIIAAYYGSLNSVTLYGPTNFAPVINATASMADHAMLYSNPNRSYFILLILTDGIISDIAQTKKAIVNASSLPMSIIIVGVGSADFSAMEELDGDKYRLQSNGHYAERDIVQFVPFQKYFKAGTVNASEKLAQEVLAEIPDQLRNYMKKFGKDIPKPFK